MKKILYTIVLILTVIIGSYFLLKGTKGEIEHIEGDNIEIINNRFNNIGDIIDCYYTIDVFSGGIGPTGYNMKALITVEKQESVRIKEQYTWKRIKEVEVDQGLYTGIEVEVINEWLYCEEFTSDTLGNDFLGEVYFSEEEKCIYIIASQ